MSLTNTLHPFLRFNAGKKEKISNRVRDNLEGLVVMLDANDPTIMSLSLTEHEPVDDYIDETKLISMSNRSGCDEVRLISMSNRSGRGLISDSSDNTKKS